MPSYVSNSSINPYQSNIVSVIASFDTEGHIRPLYVRIHEESLKVYSSWMKPTFNGFIEFNCKVIDNEYLKPLVLTYHKQEDVWTIPKECMIN